MSYDKFYTQELWLSLPFEEGIGTLTLDGSIWRITPFTLHGTPAWTQITSGLMTLDFDPANPDWLDCPAVTTAKLDFTTGDFSACAWINTDSGGNRYLMCRGIHNTDGWYWLLYAGVAPVPMQVVTSQAGAYQLTESESDIDTDTWTFVSFSRSGSSIRTFKNGIDNTSTEGTHTDPLTANRELHIGIDDAEAAGYWDGQIWHPRIWGRNVEAWEWRQIFNMERHWFGV